MGGAAAAAESAKPSEKFRRDYAPVPYTIDTVRLEFQLHEEHTTVDATLHMKPLGAVGVSDNRPPLFLDGRSDLTLRALAVDGVAVPAEHFSVSPAGLTLSPAAIPSGAWDLTITTEIKPHENSLLEGLYKSGGNFCTQCEAEGFRGITYFLDRPDVMAT
jgi:aminopeptidase N